MKHVTLICVVFLGYGVSLLRAGNVVTISDGNEITGNLTLTASSIRVEGGLTPTEINLSDVLEANFGETPFPLDFFFVGGGNQLPAGWKAQDIGAVDRPGSVIAADGTFTLSGSGDFPPPPLPKGVSAPKGVIPLDKLFFVGQQWPDDSQCTVELKEIDAQSPNTEAGLMLRDTLDAGSVMARVGTTTLENGICAFRAEADTRLRATPISIGPPIWLRLTRYGTRVLASISSDEKEWDWIGQNDFKTLGTPWIGLYANTRTAHEPGKVVFDQVSFTPLPSSAQILPPGVLLQSGSFLAGDFSSLNFDPATPDANGNFNRNGKPMLIPRSKIAAITMLPTAWSQIAGMGSHVGILMKNGDVMDGTPENINGNGVSISSLLLGLTTYDRNEVFVCFLHPLQVQPANYEIRLRDGSSVNATGLSVGDNEAAIAEVSGLTIHVSLDEIAQFRAGPSLVQSLAGFDWKATPPPASAPAKAGPVANAPPVANAVSDAPPPVQCWEGNNQEQIMEALAGTVLEFPLTGKFRALGMRVALSSDSPPASNVIVRVLADGREVARTPPFRAGDAPRFMEVTMQDPGTLTLVAESFNPGAKVLFIDPVLLRDNN